MKQYKTYQEAKIENPSCDVFRFSPHDLTKGEYFFTGKVRHGQLVDGGAVFRCNPAGYCMNLERFFDAGHKLVDGDMYEGFCGRVYTIGAGVTASDANYRVTNDAKHYILHAKALEKSNLEWANGDECYYKSNAQSVKFIGKCNIDNTCCWISICNDYAHVLRVKIDDLNKPEAPEAKVKREALELFNAKASYNIHYVIKKLSNAGMLKSKGEK